MEDDTWKTIQNMPFAAMPFRVHNMPGATFDSWSRGAGVRSLTVTLHPGSPGPSRSHLYDGKFSTTQHPNSTENRSSGPATHAEAGWRPPSINANGLISSQRLQLLLKYVTEHPFISHGRLAVEGLEVAVEEARMIMILNMKASQKKNIHQHGQFKHGSPNKGGDAGSRVGLNVSPISAKAGSIVSGSTTAVQVKTQDVAVARKVAASEKIKEMQMELRIAREQKMAEFMSEDAMDEMKDDASPRTVQPGVVPQEPSAIQGLLKDSVVGDVRIGSSVSTKLDYILSEVCPSSSSTRLLILS